MSTIKISELPKYSTINANTANTLFVGVDTPTDTTYQFTAHTLAQGLYANEILNVGINPVLFTNTVAQFSGSDPSYLQSNMQNFDANGTTDIVVTNDNSVSYIDMGICGTNYDRPTATAYNPNDGYIFVNSGTNNTGNLLLATGTTGTSVIFAIGESNTINVVASVTATGLVLSTPSYLTFADRTKQSTAGAPYAYSNASFLYANTQVGLINGVNVTQNTSITAAFTQANAAFLYANTQVGLLNGVDVTQNTSISAAFNKANNALANTSGVIFAGDITFTGNAYIGNAAISSSGVYSIGAFNGTYTDGTVLDYTTGNGRISVGPADKLTFYSGGPAATKTLEISSNGTVSTSNVSLSGNLTSNGVVTITSTGSLIVNGPAIYNSTVVNNGNRTNNGNTTFNGPLTANGAVQINSTLVTTGAVVIGGTMIPANNNISLGSIANPFLNFYTQNSDVVFANSNVSVLGTFTANGLSTFNGNVITTGTLTTVGALTVSGNSIVSGTSNIAGTMIATGNVITNGLLNVNGALQANGISTFTGNVVTNGTLLTVGSLTVQGTSNITGNMIISGNTSITGNVIQTGTATQNGASLFYGTISSNSTISTTSTVNPSNGVINTVRVNGITPLTINFTTDSIVRANITANFVISPANFVAGKMVEVWLVNNSTGGGSAHTITHGITNVNHSTNGGTTFSLTGTQTARIVYMCADGTLANTFVAITSSGV